MFQTLKNFCSDHLDRSEYMSKLSSSGSSACIRLQRSDAEVVNGDHETEEEEEEIKYNIEFKDEDTFDAGLQIMSQLLKSTFFAGYQKERKNR